MKKSNIDWAKVKNTPQKTTVLGITGIYSQYFGLLKDVKVGELWPYLTSLTYGELFGIFAPLIVFIWAIIHDEKEGK